MSNNCRCCHGVDSTCSISAVYQIVSSSSPRVTPAVLDNPVRNPFATFDIFAIAYDKNTMIDFACPAIPSPGMRNSPHVELHCSSVNPDRDWTMSHKVLGKLCFVGWKVDIGV